MESIRVVMATFKNKISEEELPYFRGSIIRLSGNDPYFHNHQEDGFHYAYPLVQYKRIDGHAVIWGINEGGEAIKRLFEDRVSYACQLGKRAVEMELIGIRSEVVSLDMDKEYVNPYEDDPKDIRAIGFNPNGTVLDGNVYESSISEIMKNYRGE